MFLITCRFYPSGEAFGTASDDATVSIPNLTSKEILIWNC